MSSSGEQSNFDSDVNPAELLAWHVAMGADEAIGEDPVDRFVTVQEVTAAAPAAHQQTARPSAPIMPERSVPTPVAPRPVQSADGAGKDAAIAAANEVTSLEALYEAMKAFDGGVIKRSAKNTVFADGTVGAPLMVIGEAPGREDDLSGKPYSGEMGAFLDKMLTAARMQRTDLSYLTTLLPWRPLGGKTPDAATVAMCLPFLVKHIELAKPKALLLLGSTPARALLDTEDSITRLRGRWKDIDIAGTTIPVMCTFDPARLLKQPHQKGHAWRDLLAVKEKIS